jgi:hypothetical protein
VTAPWVSSESTAAIIPAFVVALQSFDNVEKTRRVNAGQMNYTYADLAAVLENTKDVLTKNGLAVTQSASDDGVRTIVLHKSGEWLAFPPLTVATQQNTPQGQGSALTYSRRYSLLAVLGIATEDDDGHAAAKPRVEAPVDTENIKAATVLYARLLQLRGTTAAEAVKALAERHGRGLREVDLRDREWRDLVAAELDSAEDFAGTLLDGVSS